MLPKKMLAGMLIAPLLILPLAAKADPVGWRTNWTGQYPEDIPPLTWSTDKSVVWKVPTKKWSNATVVLYEDRLFYGEEPSTLICASKKTGKELWRVTTDFAEIILESAGEIARKQKEELEALRTRDAQLLAEDRRISEALRKDRTNPDLKKQFGEIRSQRNQVRRQLQALSRRSNTRPPATHNSNGYTSSTPVIDDGKIYVLYGTGAAAAYTLDGQRLWARIVGRPSNGWGHSASPVLVDGKLIVHLGATVYGLDPKTGQTLWTTASSQFWGTPFPFTIGHGTWAVITTGGVVIRAADGKVLAQGIGVMPWSSPVVKDGVLYIADEKGAFAYRVPENDAAPFEKLWQAPIPRDRYYASPIIHDGLLYNVTQKGRMSVLDISDGSTVYTHNFRLGGTFYPSITLAGAFLFASSDTGKTALFFPGRKYKEIGINQLDGFRTNLVFEGTRLYVRTLKALYCLSESP